MLRKPLHSFVEKAKWIDKKGWEQRKIDVPINYLKEKGCEGWESWEGWEGLDALLLSALFLLQKSPEGDTIIAMGALAPRKKVRNNHLSFSTFPRYKYPENPFHPIQPWANKSW